MEKSKRIVTKAGDVFCAEIDGKYKCFFQYIINDVVQKKNSNVVRVFKRRSLFRREYRYADKTAPHR